MWPPDACASIEECRPGRAPCAHPACPPSRRGSGPAGRVAAAVPFGPRLGRRRPPVWDAVLTVLDHMVENGCIPTMRWQCTVGAAARRLPARTGVWRVPNGRLAVRRGERDDAAFGSLARRPRPHPLFPAPPPAKATTSARGPSLTAAPPLCGQPAPATGPPACTFRARPGSPARRQRPRASRLPSRTRCASRRTPRAPACRCRR